MVISKKINVLCFPLWTIYFLILKGVDDIILVIKLSNNVVTSLTCFFTFTKDCRFITYKQASGNVVLYICNILSADSRFLALSCFSSKKAFHCI